MLSNAKRQRQIGSFFDKVELSVDLTRSGVALESVSPTAAEAGVTLCVVDGEYFSYTTATLAASDRYQLTGLYRGLRGSAAAAHLSGATFCELDSAILRYDLSDQKFGQTVHLKFQSFNIFGGGLQDLSTCVEYTHTIQGCGVIGPVTASLAIGAPLDFGLVGAFIAQSDDFGNLSAPVMTVIDLGTLAD
jgi:hypothetical protein